MVVSVLPNSCFIKWLGLCKITLLKHSSLCQTLMKGMLDTYERKLVSTFYLFILREQSKCVPFHLAHPERNVTTFIQRCCCDRKLSQSYSSSIWHQHCCLYQQCDYSKIQVNYQSIIQYQIVVISTPKIWKLGLANKNQDFFFQILEGSIFCSLQ